MIEIQYFRVIIMVYSAVIPMVLYWVKIDISAGNGLGIAAVWY